MVMVEEPKPRKRRGCLWAVLAGLAIFVILIALASGGSDKKTEVPVTAPVSDESKSQEEVKQPSEPEAPKKKILVKVTDVKYEYGFVTVTGTATNVGTESVYSPTIQLEIADSTGSTILAKSPTWPAGWYLEHVPPGASAGFEVMAHPTGEPENIKWRVYVEEYPFEVVKE